MFALKLLKNQHRGPVSRALSVGPTRLAGVTAGSTPSIIAVQGARHNSSSNSPPPTNSKGKTTPGSSGLPLEETSPGRKFQPDDVALDMFFSGYRPLFLVDHFGTKNTNNNNNNTPHTPSKDNKNYMPWDVSVSGVALNPEMKQVPRAIVRNLVPFQPTPTEQEALDRETAQVKKIVESTGNHKNGVKVISFEINNNSTNTQNNSSTHSSMFNNNSNNSNEASTTEVSIVVDAELADHPEITRSLNRIKRMLSDPTEIRSGPQLFYSPVSYSFGRFVHATSVKRKRKLKMNKHKLRKRRKLQRSERRRLKK